MAFMLHTMIKWFAQRLKNIYYVEIRIAILTIVVRKGSGHLTKMFKRERKVIRVNRFKFKTNSTNSLPLNIH